MSKSSGAAPARDLPQSKSEQIAAAKLEITRLTQLVDLLMKKIEEREAIVKRETGIRAPLQRLPQPIRRLPLPQRPQPPPRDQFDARRASQIEPAPHDDKIDPLDGAEALLSLSQTPVPTLQTDRQPVVASEGGPDRDEEDGRNATSSRAHLQELNRGGRGSAELDGPAGPFAMDQDDQPPTRPLSFSPPSMHQPRGPLLSRSILNPCSPPHPRPVHSTSAIPRSMSPLSPFSRDQSDRPLHHPSPRILEMSPLRRDGPFTPPMLFFCSLPAEEATAEEIEEERLARIAYERQAYQPMTWKESREAHEQRYDAAVDQWHKTSEADQRPRPPWSPQPRNFDTNTTESQDLPDTG